MAWETVNCKAGHAHVLYKQQKLESCGPSCVMMVYERMTGDQLKEADVRSTSQEFPGHYRPSPEDVGAKGAHYGLQVLAFFAKQAVTDPNAYTGTMADNLSQTLNTFLKAPASSTTTFASAKTLKKSVLKKATMKRPLIALVNWVGGGGHFVVIDRFVKHYFGRSEFCVCDPIYGVSTITMERDTIETYTDTNVYGAIYKPSGAPTVKGVFNGWVVTV